VKHAKKEWWVFAVLVAMAAAVILFAGCENPNSGDGGGTLVSVEDVALSETAEKTVAVGGTFELTAVITPSNASDTKIIWRSLQPNVAAVFGNGLAATVLAVSRGQTIIMAVTEDGGKIASCPVTVTTP
jgi:uncharacterized protein YjdB